MTPIGANNSPVPRGRKVKVTGHHQGCPAVLNSSELTGFPSENGDPVTVSGEVPGRPASLAWMTDELIAETQRVWSPLYGRQLSRDDAVEILRNVKRFAEVMMSVQREGGKP
jgi:hypothetical protein